MNNRVIFVLGCILALGAAGSYAVLAYTQDEPTQIKTIPVEQLQGKVEPISFIRAKSISIDEIEIDESDLWVQGFSEDFVVKIHLADQFAKKGAMKLITNNYGQFDVDAILIETEKTIEHYKIEKVKVKRIKKDKSVTNEDYAVRKAVPQSI